MHIVEKEVPGHPHIVVRSDGTAYSKGRYVLRNGKEMHVPGRELKGSRHDSGHISLSVSKGGVPKKEYLHRLMYLAFKGDIPDGMEVRHLDGDPSNNRISNLAIGDRASQRRDDVRNGVHPQARKTHCKRGHLLAEWNLDTGRLKKGHRVCLSCKRAMMTKAHRGLTEGQAKELADQNYTRVRQAALEGTEVSGCVSCTL